MKKRISLALSCLALSISPLMIVTSCSENIDKVVPMTFNESEIVYDEITKTVIVTKEVTSEDLTNANRMTIYKAMRPMAFGLLLSETLTHNWDNATKLVVNGTDVIVANESLSNLNLYINYDAYWNPQEQAVNKNLGIDSAAKFNLTVLLRDRLYPSETR